MHSNKEEEQGDLALFDTPWFGPLQRFIDMFLGLLNRKSAEVYE